MTQILIPLVGMLTGDTFTDISLLAKGGVYSPTQSKTAGGSIGTVTLSALAAVAVLVGAGSLGTISPTPPQASITTIGEGAIGTVNLSPPGVTPSVVVLGSLGTITLSPPLIQFVRATQFGLLASTVGFPDARATQFGLNTLAIPPVKARVTQMGQLVLATGGPVPLKPDPLSLSDMGRKPALRQRLVNMYTEPTPQGPGNSARYPRPGLYSAAVRGDGPIRASFLWNDFRVTVSGGQVWIDGNNIGLITGSTAGPLRFAFSQEELVMVSAGQAWYITQTTVAPIASATLPTTLIDVVFLAGRFVYVDGATSTAWYSELEDARNVDSLSFFTVAEDSARLTIGAVVLVDNIVFFTENALEWWYPADDPLNPFARSQGRKNDRGCAAILTITKLDNSVFFLGENRIIYRTGAVPQRVSDFSVEDELRRAAQDDLPNCAAFGIIYGGHTFYVIHIIGRGSWAYDVSNSTWAEWKTWNKPLYRVTTCDDKGVCGDRYSGNLMGVNGEIFTDLGDPIERIVSTYLPLKTGRTMNFNLALDCVRGVGLPTGFGSDPQVEMRYSDGEGRNFSDWVKAPLGMMGDATDQAKAVWYQLGAIRSPGRLFEFRCADPVFFAPWQVRFNEPRP